MGARWYNNGQQLTVVRMSVCRAVLRTAADAAAVTAAVQANGLSQNGYGEHLYRPATSASNVAWPSSVFKPCPLRKILKVAQGFSSFLSQTVFKNIPGGVYPSAFH